MRKQPNISIPIDLIKLKKVDEPSQVYGFGDDSMFDEESKINDNHDKYQAPTF